MLIIDKWTSRRMIYLSVSHIFLKYQFRSILNCIYIKIQMDIFFLPLTDVISSIHPFIQSHQSIRLQFHPSIHLFINSSIYLYTFQSNNPSAQSFIHPFIHSPIYPFIRPSIYPSVSVWFSFRNPAYFA